MPTLDPTLERAIKHTLIYAIKTQGFPIAIQWFEGEEDDHSYLVESEIVVRSGGHAKPVKSIYDLDLITLARIIQDGCHINDDNFKDIVNHLEREAQIRSDQIIQSLNPKT
jgi:hypothetical protein